MYRNDCRAGALRRGHHARLERPARAPGPIGRERDRLPRLELSHCAEQGPGSAPCTRPAAQPIAQHGTQVRQVLTFARLAHHDHHALVPVVPEEGQQRLVPEQEHVGPTGRHQPAPPLLLLGPDAPGPGEEPEGRDGVGTNRTRRDPQPHAVSSSSARATTRSVAPGSPRRARTRASPSRCRTVLGSRGSSSGRSASTSAGVSARSCSNSGTTSRSATRLTRLTQCTVRSRWNSRYVSGWTLYATTIGVSASAASSVVVPDLARAASAAANRLAGSSRTICAGPGSG